MDNRRTTYDGTLTKRRDPLELRADAAQGILTGHASRWWVVDSYAEATAPGAFAETIAQRGPSGANRILLRYEHENTIGTHRSLTEGDEGLAIEGHVSDDGMYGTVVRKHLADGVPYGISIGFRRLADRTAEDGDPLDLSTAPDWVKGLPRNEIRILTRVQLYENSVVSFPAVDPATVESYRAVSGLWGNELDISALLAAVKSGRLTDEQTTQLRALLAVSPADGRLETGTGEMPSEKLPVAHPTQTARRKRLLAYTELRARMAGLEIGVTS